MFTHLPQNLRKGSLITAKANTKATSLAMDALISQLCVYIE